MLTFKQKLAKNYINAHGWRTKRKLLLIESDDWGAIRMPSRKVYDFLLSKNIRVDQSYFDRNDSIESTDDLESLYDLLDKYRDINNNPPVITAFTVTANPDFEKIEATDLKEYHYELITKTYKGNAHTERTFELFQEGIQNKFIYPQFHGREHININRWMEAINSPSIKEQTAFKLRALISSKYDDDVFQYPSNYFAAFDFTKEDDVSELNQITADGLSNFEKLFGFKSISFVAPCSIWSDVINESLSEGDVKLQVGQQTLPKYYKRSNVVNRFWGSKNNFSQIHWRRNCSFEPSRDQDYDWVNRCLREIEIAYRWGKPAVINSHRVNFIGSIFPENRAKTHQKLKLLIEYIQNRWPEVEFVNTEQLGKIMLDTIK